MSPLYPEQEQPLVPPPIVAAPEPPLTNALSGPFGLRAGWGILFFVILSALLGFVLVVGALKATGQMAKFQQETQRTQQAARLAKATHTQPVPQPMPLSLALPEEAGQTAAVLLAALGLSFLERRRFSVYGLGSQHLRDALPGAFWGLVALSLLVGLLRATHVLVFDRRILYGAAVFRYGAGWLVLFAFVGAFEEFFFRGYLQFTLTRGLLGLGRRLSPGHAQRAAFWISATFVSLLFALVHLANSGENRAGIFGVFMAGILFSYALWRTGSLWWGVGCHMTWDWAQSFLYGVPDSGTLSAGRLFTTHALGKPLLSGGVDGPEGSLWLLPVLALLFLAVRLQRQAEQPPLEPLSFPAFVRSEQPQRIA